MTTELRQPSLIQDHTARSAGVLCISAFGILAGAWIGLRPLLSWIHDMWSGFFGVGPYTHGYIVLALSVWIGVQRWREAPPTVLSPYWPAGLALLGLIASLYGLQLAGINSSRAMLLPLYFLAAVAFVYGRDAAVRLVPAAMFIYLGLTPWWLLEPTLEVIAVKATGTLLSVSELPFHIEGQRIHIPAGTFEIVSACSGLSFTLSALTLAVFYSAMYLKTWPHRIILIAVAIFAAMASNSVRIAALILIGERSQMQHWLMDDHYGFGWTVFVVALAPVLWLATHLEMDGGGKKMPQRSLSLPILNQTGIALAAIIVFAAMAAQHRFVL
jgi:exosortase